MMAFGVQRITFLNKCYLFGSQLLLRPRATLCTAAESSPEDAGTSESSDGEDVRERLFQAALGYVHQHGWTRQAIVAAAEAEGLPPVVHGLFPRGGADLVNHFYRSCNADLSQQMEQQVKDREEKQETMKTSMFIRYAVQDRLSMVAPYRQTWSQAMAIMALPQNAPTAWCNLADLVDSMWFHAGDKSVDMNWYTKRLSLAAVYKSTELYMLQDESEDLVDTWIFLERRLHDLSLFGQNIRKIKKSSGAFSEGLYSAGILAQNMLGVNCRSR